MKEDAWKWQVYKANLPFAMNEEKPLLFEGECQSYTACLMTFKLLGIRSKKSTSDAGYHAGRTFIYYGDTQVFIVFTRKSDGKSMTEWGSSAFEFPPGMNSVE
jgi:hypothetical protein